MESSYAKVAVEEDIATDDIELTDIRMSSLVQSALDEDYDDDDDDGDKIPKYNGWALGAQMNFEDTSSLPRPSLDQLEEQLLYNVWNRWEEPCLLSVVVTIFVLTPTLVLWTVAIYMFTGRFWSISLFTTHFQLRLAVSLWYVKSVSEIRFRRRKMLRLTCSLMTLLEIGLCGAVYPFIVRSLEEAFFRDVDGTIVIEWQDEDQYYHFLKYLGWTVVVARAVIGICAISIRSIKHFSSEPYREWRPTFWTPNNQDTMNDKTRTLLYNSFQFASCIFIGLNAVCLLSAISHFGPWPMPPTAPQICDPLDTTECSLPFPSFHHMRRDPRSATGWRVHLKGLPPLRGGLPFHPQFLNELDGFSTMAPILFYMEGLKEAYEQNTDNRLELQGLERITYSTTPQSITFLVNVDNQELVPHSAEVDYLDADRPMIMVIPAQPLRHATHYAVAVVNAPDKEGHKLKPTPGMQKLLKETNSEQRERFLKILIPALEKAAPWVEFAKEPEAVQLMFDFVTISEESQLGPIRATRDATLTIVEKWDWHKHVKIVDVEQQECDSEGSLIAKTIYINFDTPSFMKNPKSRYSSLDSESLANGKPVDIIQTTATIKVPCSLETGTEKLQTIMEYGHGLFADRGEMNDEFLSRYVFYFVDLRSLKCFF